ncbi:ubiquinone/menaquinone biosynthesis methyltransferase [Desulfohalovibrio reitneri]|uniref:ubiquinone/menaquinone biosynthesis methyltransferase n=1 Tax=Desulfohalovibrio reitneri TaxID=1307759 RepID=UPI0009DF628A|nr:ubiquinone/menaquinone biosynthesis methyltransferase [Desulfohalovibrio reitneri]
MFGRIARVYDPLNRTLSLGQDVWWRKRLVAALRPEPGRPVLDLACGTLDVGLECRRRYPDTPVLAMDFSEPMLRRGRDKALARGEIGSVLPALADGRALPLPDESVAAASIAFGIRNIRPRSDAFAELHRVLRPGGRLGVLEFGTGRARIWKGAYNFYLNRVLPGVGRLVSGDSGAYRYLADTIREFPPARELAGEMRQAGFDRVAWLPLLSGIVYLHVAEKAPTDDVRRGPAR